MLSVLLRTYGELTQLKMTDKLRVQPALANLRDELSKELGLDPEVVQLFAERTAEAFRKEASGD